MSSDYYCDELRRVLALLEREAEVMENKEQYDKIVKMLHDGFGEAQRITILLNA